MLSNAHQMYNLSETSIKICHSVKCFLLLRLLNSKVFARKVILNCKFQIRKHIGSKFNFTRNKVSNESICLEGHLIAKILQIGMQFNAGRIISVWMYTLLFILSAGYMAFPNIYGIPVISSYFWTIPLRICASFSSCWWVNLVTLQIIPFPQKNHTKYVGQLHPVNISLFH